ncbi:MAG: hypothetical protein NVSMB66_3770 [Candidatus Doudnabacteria bacterium]
MAAIFLSLATFVSTLGGGLFALKFKNKLHLIMGFTAGVILAVISFDILPEIIRQVNENHFDSMPAMIGLVCGFLIFHILEKVIVVHHAHEEEYADHTHPDVGVLSALALAGHSFVDGVGIGLGFQISPTVGALVALAVIAHDFTDGMNTVALMLTHKNTIRKSVVFLILDATTPVLGAISTLFFKLPPNFLVIYLGFFAGFLLYIGASDILPQAHSKKPSLYTVALTVFGTLFTYIVLRMV